MLTDFHCIQFSLRLGELPNVYYQSRLGVVHLGTATVLLVSPKTIPVHSWCCRDIVESVVPISVVTFFDVISGIALCFGFGTLYISSMLA